MVGASASGEDVSRDCLPLSAGRRAGDYFVAPSGTVGFHGTAMTQRLLGAAGAVLSGLLYGFGVDLGAEQEGVGSGPEPGENHHDTRHSAVGFAVAAEAGDVDRGADRGDQPEHRGATTAPTDTQRIFGASRPRRTR